MPRNTVVKSKFMTEKYRFRQALRPFSFSVAFIVCLTGILVAAREGVSDLFLSFLIISAGLLLQAGVNLINDHADLGLSKSRLDFKSAALIKQNFKYGLCCFLIAAAIGIYLIFVSGIGLLWLSVLGFLGALGYTMEPVNYKRRGLAVVFVFWLMGVFMVLGSYYVMTSQISSTAFYLSIPVSIFTSLLLLSNEIRDFEADRSQGIGTLSVRIGYTAAIRLYVGLLAIAYLSSLILWGLGFLPYAWIVLFSLPLMIKPLGYLNRTAVERKPLTPATGVLFFAFGSAYCSALAFS